MDVEIVLDKIMRLFFILVSDPNLEPSLHNRSTSDELKHWVSIAFRCFEMIPLFVFTRRYDNKLERATSDVKARRHNLSVQGVKKFRLCGPNDHDIIVV